MNFFLSYAVWMILVLLVLSEMKKGIIRTEHLSLLLILLFIRYTTASADRIFTEADFEVGKRRCEKEKKIEWCFILEGERGRDRKKRLSGVSFCFEGEGVRYKKKIEWCFILEGKGVR